MILIYHGRMSNVTIPPEQWSKILTFLRECPDVYVGAEDKCKLFVEAVLWITSTGAQWRMIPIEYGKWNTIYKRFARWAERSVWEQMHEFIIEEPGHGVSHHRQYGRSGSPVRWGSARKKGANRRRRSAEAEAGSAPRST